MIVGCKQDLERTELPFVEIEALVTTIKMKMKIPLILLLITTIIKIMKIVLILLDRIISTLLKILTTR